MAHRFDAIVLGMGPGWESRQRPKCFTGWAEAPLARACDMYFRDEEADLLCKTDAMTW